MANIDLDVVESFLKIVRRDVLKGNVHFVNRQVHYGDKRISSYQALLDLGIRNKKELWKYILNLSPTDCIKISRDYDFSRDYNDDMYEFIIFINSIKIYIKLTINNRGTLCLSFHKSDR